MRCPSRSPFSSRLPWFDTWRGSSYVDQSQSLLTWSPVRLFSSYALLPPSLSISDPHCLFTPFSKSPSCPSLHGSEHHRCGLACTETGADGLVGRLEVLSRFEAEVGEGEEGEMDKDLMILSPSPSPLSPLPFPPTALTTL